MSESIKSNFTWRPDERVLPTYQLVQAAQVNIDPKRSIKSIYKSLENLLAKADDQLIEQDLQLAYVYYMRYSTIVLKFLPKHHEYRLPKYAKQKEEVNKRCITVLSILERLKPTLQRRYEVYQERMKQMEKMSVSVTTFKLPKEDSPKRAPLPGIQEHPRKDSTADIYGDGGPKIHLDRYEDEAKYGYNVADALKGVRISDNSMNTRRVSSSSYTRDPNVRTETLIEYPSLEASSAAASASRPPPPQIDLPLLPVLPKGGDTWQNSTPHTQQTPPPIPARPRRASAANPGMITIPEHTSMASVQPGIEFSPPPPGHANLYDPTFSPSPVSGGHTPLPSSAPALPPKPREYCDDFSGLATETNTIVPLGDLAQMSPTALPQCVISPDEYALTEAGERMRPMQIPEDIFEEFIRIAEPNTQQNLETCGVLCGKVVPGQETLVVTTLIIPKQKATSDTCTTENEEELVVTQMQLELLTLGWIHTHPSQTCFMSSLDLHTHFSYQQFMPEAIAIVCSPKYDPRYGVFRLTDPSGMDVIKSCKQEAAFHPHDGSDIIYTNADPDGHVVKARYSFEIIDLRNA